MSILTAILPKVIYQRYVLCANDILENGINDVFTWGQREFIFSQYSKKNGCNFCSLAHNEISKLLCPEHDGSCDCCGDSISEEVMSHINSNNSKKPDNISDEEYVNLIAIESLALFINNISKSYGLVASDLMECCTGVDITGTQYAKIIAEKGYN